MPAKKIVKGYKIFDNDWTCRGFQYEIGGEYVHKGKIELCEAGFHFCRKLSQCLDYYPLMQCNKIAEVEASDRIKEIENKCVTSRLKIVREISFKEAVRILDEELSENYTYFGIYQSDGINQSYGVHYSKGVNRSKGINGANGVNYSDGVNNSKGVNCSSGVSYSHGVYSSDGVNCSNGVNNSGGVNGSNGVSWAGGVSYSHGVHRSGGVHRSAGVNCSKGVNNSGGVNNCESIDSCFGILNCKGLSKSIFCADLAEEAYLFNKRVSIAYINDVREELNSLLDGWYPSFDNFKALSMKHGGEWEEIPISMIKSLTVKEAWADMPEAAITYLKSLPEFDAEIFEKITGINVNESEAE